MTVLWTHMDLGHRVGEYGKKGRKREREGREGAVRRAFLEEQACPGTAGCLVIDWMAGFLALAGLSPLDLQSSPATGEQREAETRTRRLSSSNQRILCVGGSWD